MANQPAPETALKTEASLLQSAESKLHAGKTPSGSLAAHVQSLADKMTQEVGTPTIKKDVMNEGIGREEEERRLSELKGLQERKIEEELREHPEGIRKGSEAATAQSATSSYARALAKEHGNTVQEVLASAQPDPQVDEKDLNQELHEEAKIRQKCEASIAGHNPKDWPAANVQSAADKVEKIVSAEKE